MELGDRETVALYLFLQKREDELDDTLFTLFTKIQKRLYEELSIEEMESIEDLYQKKVDILNRGR